MGLSRRDFIKVCTGSVTGFGISQMFHPLVRDLLADTLVGELPPVFWVEGQGCTGCTVTLLNGMHPAIADILLKVISVQYHPTIMAAEGSLAFASMLKKAKEYKGRYIYIVEGSIPIEKDGKYCVVGEVDHHEYTMMETTEIMARNAAVVMAVGACSAYGGVSAAKGQRTGAMSVEAFLAKKNISKPVINIAGCPPHPDWILGSMLMLLDAIKRYGLEKGIAEMKGSLDSLGRPSVFYPNTHLTCTYLQDYKDKKFCTSLTDKKGCRIAIGCKGPGSACDSAIRRWNGGVSWCIESGTCIGCTQATFPDSKTPLYR